MSILDREILALMREATDKAILPRYQNLQHGEVEDKSADGEARDPVTIADHEAEQLLSEGLARLEPGCEVVGEEGAHGDEAVMRHLTGPCWIVDPIDGTRNFASGQPPFGILIARADGGEVSSGWLFDCISGRFCAAHRGEGAFVDGERITARGTGEDPPVAAISLLFMDEEKRKEVSRRIAPQYRLTDIPYCAAEQYPRIGLGVNDVSIFERTLPWDHAAGALWLEEAGGKAARLDGSPYRVDEWQRKGLLAASTPELWEGMAARLNALNS